MDNKQPEDFPYRGARLRRQRYAPDERIYPVLGLSVRTCNVLIKAGITTVSKLATLSQDDLLQIRGLGPSGLKDIKTKLNLHLSSGQEAPQVLKQSQQELDASFISMLTEQRKKGRKVCSTLTRREHEVLKLHFGLEDGQTRTLEEIGRQFNITRQRVCQIEAKALRKLRHPTRRKLIEGLIELPTKGVCQLLRKVSPLLSLPQAATLLKCDPETLLELVEAGQLKSVKRHDDRLFFRARELLSVEIPSKRCIICGQLIPRGRKSYCSTECFKERWRKYRNWPEERKVKHKELVEKWHQEHPEQARIIQRRATSKYQRKVARIRSFEKMVSDITSWRED